MSNTTLEILPQKKPTLNFSEISNEDDRCLVCGLKENLKFRDGHWYCPIDLEDEEKLDTIVEYYTDFSGPDPFETEKKEGNGEI